MIITIIVIIRGDNNHDAGSTLVQQPTTTDNNNMDIDVSEETEFFEVRIDAETVDDLLFDLEKRTDDV